LVGDDGLDPFLLIADAGRSGGRIELAISVLKKLDFRRFDKGEGGICDKVSTVLSDSDGFGFRLSFGGFGWRFAASERASVVSFAPPEEASPMVGTLHRALTACGSDPEASSRAKDIDGPLTNGSGSLDDDKRGMREAGFEEWSILALTL
jgi:hypothetical protein